MSLNESIVEDAALEWFGELGYAVGQLASAISYRILARLLPKLLSGELSVMDEERQIERATSWKPQLTPPTS